MWLAPPLAQGTGADWSTVLVMVIGSALALVGTLLTEVYRDWHTTRRQREEREVAVIAQQRELQRQTLASLMDAISKAAMEVNTYVASAKERDEWPPGVPHPELQSAILTLSTHEACVEDDQLRVELLDKAFDVYLKKLTFHATDAANADELAKAVMVSADEALTRAGELRRTIGSR